MINLPGALIAEATKWIGVMEKGGPNKGPEVERFQKAVDGKAQGESWCMSFVQFCVMEVEKRSEVDSPLFRSEHCLTVWNKSPLYLRLPADPGSLVIWRHGDTASGHVGIVERIGKGGLLHTIEGNTGAGAGVVREGDGVYRRQRNPKGEGTMRVVGFLSPWAVLE